MLRHIALFIALLSLSAVAGCKRGATEPTTPEPEPAAAEPAEDDAGVRIEGSRLVIPRHILFANNSDVILEESYDILRGIVVLLRRTRTVTTLHVTGHTDLRGSEEDNQALSERRAASVVNALRERGLTIAIDSVGRGESEPLCTETTPECDERNRRVEFVIESQAQ